MNRDPYNYGNLLYCVKTSLSEDNDIFINADTLSYTPNGDVVFKGRYRGDNPGKPPDKNKEEDVRMIISKGKWDAIYQVSPLTFEAISVDRWEGEIVND
jgi:hypothetical protein|tara:strand:+ start:165 stop:461 length:297 start_codon:yes stop_codon:yes gene_type:complete